MCVFYRLPGNAHTPTAYPENHFLREVQPLTSMFTIGTWLIPILCSLGKTHENLEQLLLSPPPHSVQGNYKLALER
jgi:hypothetical protein